MNTKHWIRFAFSMTCILGLILSATLGTLTWAFQSGQRSVTTRPAFVGFTCLEREPTDSEVSAMVDDVISQVLGAGGLTTICKPGDHVVIKVNLVNPQRGRIGEEGRGIVTDPRIVRHVAELVREAVGPSGDIVVTDATFYKDPNPSLRNADSSFYFGRLKRNGDSDAEREICYDGNADGILDGSSGARLENADGWGMDRRFATEQKEPTLGTVKVYFPNFLRTREQAHGKPPYCDVLIGIPVFKSHGAAGITGALKLSYGFRYFWTAGDEDGRSNHSGYGFWGTGNLQLLLDYLCAQQKTRPYDFILLDALTGNRQGPNTPDGKTMHQPVDFILTDAVLASKDPVALDTVEAAFAGYDPKSIGLLSTAAADGLGQNRPEYITVAGWDRFVKHKQFLLKAYNGNGMDKPGTYPFLNGRGGARVLRDFEAPAITRFEMLESDGGYSFRYKIKERGKAISGLARIDLIVDGQVITTVQEPKSSGEFAFDPLSFHGKTITYQCAVWDRVLNCTISEPKKMEIK